MRSICTYAVAAFMLLWYSWSIIGFNVHTCSGSGETYIATLTGGFSCEDIHPDHQESECTCCCSDEPEKKLFDEELNNCCTNDYQVILLTGVKAEEKDYRVVYGSDLSHSAILYSVEKSSAQSLKKTFDIYNQGFAQINDIQRMYGVWRI